MKLLIAYDGSACANAAIDDLGRAGLPAASGDAVVLTVADVWPPLVDPNPPADHRLANPAIRELTRAARAKAEQALADARTLAETGAARARTALPPAWAVRALAVAGSPYGEVVRQAESLGADLIVVGSHGRSVLGRAVLGSVSQKVLHHAPCSVRVARGADAAHTGAATAAVRPPRVVLGVDGSAGADAAVAAIADRAWPAGAEVRVVCVRDVRVIEMTIAAALVVGPTPSDDAHLGRMLVAAADRLRRPGLTVTTALRDGDPRQVLAHEAAEWRADCLFVGAQGLSLLDRFLIGSVSASVAANAPCSVEVVRSRT